MMKDTITILMIAIIGWYGSVTLADINEFLETIVLTLTIAGLVYKILNIKYHGKKDNSKKERG